MRNVSVFLLLAAWAGTGCIGKPWLWGDPKAPPAPATVPAAPKPHRPVTAEQITEMNAREKAAQLLNELEQETPIQNAKPAELGKLP